MADTALQQHKHPAETMPAEVTRGVTYTPRVDILESEDELVLWPESAWPRLAILLLRPDPQDLAARPPS